MPFYEANATQACIFVLPKSVADSVGMKCIVVLSIGPIKGRKLLVPVRCTTRKFYLQPPPTGKNDWYVRLLASR